MTEQGNKINKVQCVFGIMVFLETGCLVYHIDKEEHVDERIAEDYCQSKIDSGEHDSYVIPSLYYIDAMGCTKGKVDYGFCDNSF
ncbi:hypothetical protein NXX53_06895 [Bacteroides salyersiae]|nr:hypothetical protein [Bacteroides salyersiae]